MAVICVVCGLFTACDADKTTSANTRPGPLVVHGAIFDGGGRPTNNMMVSWEVRASGCVGTALLPIQSATVHGTFRTSFDTRTLPSTVCVIATSRPLHLRETAWATAIGQVDSVTLTPGRSTPIEINLRYDFAVLSGRAGAYRETTGQPENITYELTTPRGTQSYRFPENVEPFRIDSGSVVTVRARYSSTDAYAEVVHPWRTRADSRLGFDVWISKMNPMLHCFGCSAKVSAPIRRHDGTDTGDSLFVIWGGGAPITTVVVF